MELFDVQELSQKNSSLRWVTVNANHICWSGHTLQTLKENFMIRACCMIAQRKEPYWAMTKQLSVNIFNSACTFFFRLQGDGLHICHYISWGNLFCHACMQYGSSSAMWMSPSNSAAATSPYQQRHFIVPSKRLPLYRQPPSQSGFPHRWQRPIRVGRLQRQYSVWIHDVTTVDARRQEQRRSFHDHQAQ